MEIQNVLQKMRENNQENFHFVQYSLDIVFEIGYNYAKYYSMIIE